MNKQFLIFVMASLALVVPSRAELLEADLSIFGMD